MKRLHVMHVVYCMDTGGTEMTLRKLVAGLDQQRFENTICTIASPARLEHIPGVRSISLRRGSGSKFLVPQFVRLFRHERPDVVHSRNWGAIEAVVAAKLVRVPRVIHSEHGRDINTMHGDPWRRRMLRRLCYRLADQVFTVSNELREHYAKQLLIPVERMHVIPNGVDSNRFRPSPARARMRSHLALADDLVVLGTVGRLDPVKGYATLLNAAEQLLQAGVNLKVVIVGDGPEREQLQERASGSHVLRDCVIFVGKVANPEDWLNAFDIYVLPSLSEGMSNSLLEAMSTGLPCVVTRVGSNPDLVEEGKSGFLVNAGDASAIAERIQRLEADPKLRQKFGEAARHRADLLFSLRSMVENYSRLYAVNAQEQSASHVAFSEVKG
jgi:sugar transferase (PEP-CTERM/EpsH1 system associated)